MGHFTRNGTDQQLMSKLFIKHPYSISRTSKLSEHPPSKGGEMLKRLGGNNVCKDKKLFMGSPVLVAY